MLLDRYITIIECLSAYSSWLLETIYGVAFPDTGLVDALGAEVTGTLVVQSLVKSLGENTKN